uniref:Uncharacterized protein n=1 Tax=Meloidogyne enterolobii TaxID=390850 RepID=A0A6V7YD67_MELEN|nr:unnamed protein product [Meloidogyne enterolobii]
MAMALAAYGAHFVSDNQNLSAERKRAMEHATNTTSTQLELFWRQ